MNNWIFIRGLGRHSAHWANFPEVFKDTFPDAKIEMLDLRGNGTESHIPSLLSIKENVRDLRARTQFSEPINLLTISMGSMVGIEWAQAYPKEIASLTIINTSDHQNSKFYERLRPKSYRTLLEIISTRAEPIHIELKIFKIVAQNLNHPEKFAKEFAKYPLTSPKNLFRQLIAASTFRLPKKKPSVPILILGSHSDLLVNPICTDRIGNRWSQPVIWHENAGHDLPLEEPEWVTARIKDFI